MTSFVKMSWIGSGKSDVLRIKGGERDPCDQLRGNIQYIILRKKSCSYSTCDCFSPYDYYGCLSVSSLRSRVTLNTSSILGPLVPHSICGGRSIDVGITTIEKNGITVVVVAMS